jgi:hypothetical protein
MADLTHRGELGVMASIAKARAHADKLRDENAKELNLFCQLADQWLSNRGRASDAFRRVFKSHAKMVENERRIAEIGQ